MTSKKLQKKEKNKSIFKGKIKNTFLNKLDLVIEEKQE